MCLSCSPRFWRILTLVFTFATFTLGLCVLGVGLYLYFENCGTKCILSQLVVPLILMSFGGITMFVNGMGYVGAFYGNLCLIRVFIFLSFIVFLLPPSLRIWYSYSHGQVIAMILRDIRATISEAESNPNSEAGTMMDLIHKRYQCCGGDGQKDWNKAPPLSCCVNPNFLESTCRYPGMYVRGCASAIVRYFEHRTYTWLGLMATIPLTQLVLIIASCRLLKKLPPYFLLRSVGNPTPPP